MTQDPRTLVRGFLDSCDTDFGIAVSGGGDSMALLHLVTELGADHAPHILTVNHNLRPEAADEAAFVAQTCAVLGLHHVTLQWKGWDGAGNVQAAARDARYRLMAEYAKTTGLGSVLVGHTADDVAETFLMRLARGSGIEGLAAMRPVFHRHGARFERPLLASTRADLRDYLQGRGFNWIEDPSNDNTDFQRIKMRNLLPDLDDAGLSVKRLYETTQRLSDARDIVLHAVQNLEKHVRFDATGAAALDVTATKDAHPEVQRLLWAKLVQWMGQAAYAPRSEALKASLERARTQGRAQIGGCDIIFKQDTLILMRELKAVQAKLTMTKEIWDGKWQFSGPHAAGLIVRALGETGLSACPNWRETGYGRAALLTTPAVFQGDRLIAAPLAGLQNGWSVQIVADFASYLASH